jgi:hypothetical protein
VDPQTEQYCREHCQRCGLARSSHNPDVHHPYIKMGDKPLYCEGFVPIDPTLDVWVEDGKMVAKWLQRYLERRDSQ